MHAASLVGIELQFCPIPRTRVYLQKSPSHPQQKCQADNVPREGRAGTFWGYSHRSLQSTGGCGKPVKPLRSEQSLKGQTSLQWGAVGNKGILMVVFVCLFNSYFCSVSLWVFSSMFRVSCLTSGVQSLLVSLAPTARERFCGCLQSYLWLEAIHQRERSTDP